MQQIVWRLHLRAAPEDVYDMLATSGGRARFWAESAEESDGVIVFRFINGVTTHSRVLERLRPHRFVLDYFASRVGFELEPDGRNGTDLTLTNTGFDPTEFNEIHAGWLNVLFPLKAAVDFNIDLRTHDPSRTWEQGYIDQ